MTVAEIAAMVKSRKTATIYMDFPFSNGSHYFPVLKSAFMATLRREFAENDETGKVMHYNEHHDSLYLTEQEAEAKAA